MQSALYGAAFSIQAANMRAACNHIIQSPGGEICKGFQRALAEEQPVGIAPWRIRTLNMHDEILVVHDGTVDCKAIKDRTVERYRKHVPLLAWEWDAKESWGDK
jgi:hypothetical protein